MFFNPHMNKLAFAFEENSVNRYQSKYYPIQSQDDIIKSRMPYSLYDFSSFSITIYDWIILVNFCIW